MSSPQRRRDADKSKRGRRTWIALVILCAIGAAAAGRRMAVIVAPRTAASADFGGLNAHFEAKASLTMVHIVPSLLFVLLVPLQFVSSLRERHPRIHRWTGWVIVSVGVVLGASALWLSAHPVGGLAESSATIFFGCFFLFALGKAWRHIRAGRVELHREWATRMTAIALGVATTRPIMGIFFATSRLTGLTPHDFFGPAMWLGLTSTYLAGEAWLQTQRRESNAETQRRRKNQEAGGSVLAH